MACIQAIGCALKTAGDKQTNGSNGFLNSPISTAGLIDITFFHYF